MNRAKIQKAVAEAVTTGELQAGLTADEQLFVLKAAVRLIQLKLKGNSNDRDTADSSGASNTL